MNELKERLQSYLTKNNIPHIGNADKKVEPNKREIYRPKSIDLSRFSRCYRSFYIKQLTLEGLKKVHEYEEDFMERFLLASEMSKISRQEIKLFEIKESELDAIIKFQDKHRPKCSDFRGIPIPPYFENDYDFDGMTYHHSWDLNIWHAEGFPIPSEKKRRLSDEF